MTHTARALAGALLLWLPGCARRPAPIAVWFDEGPSALFSIHDPGFMGYSVQGRMLRGAGYHVASSTAALVRAVDALPVDGSAVVVTGLHDPRARRTDEAAALHRWIQAGGLAVILAEHDDMYGSAAFANTVLAGTGVEVTHGRAASAAGSDPRRPVSMLRLDTADTATARFYLAAPIRAEGSEAEVLGRDVAGAPLAVVLRAGKGAVAVIGDAEFPWNGAPGFGVTDGANGRVLPIVIRQLLATRGRPAPSGAVTRNSVDGAARVAAWQDPGDPRFDEDGYREFIDTLRARGVPVSITSNEVEIADADVVIIAEPTAPLPAAVTAAPRRLVLASAVSDAPSGYVPGPLRAGVATPAPVAAVSDRSDTLLPAVLRDSSGGFAVRDERWRCLWARPAAMRTSSAAIVTAPADADAQILWFRVAGRYEAPRFLAPPSNGHWPLVTRTAEILTFASGSPLRSARADQGCYGAAIDIVVRWMGDAARRERERH